jgi:hypothetical protein
MVKAPNFLCVGVQKAGTTSLYNILIQHPDIYLPYNKKEVHFFDNDDIYFKGKDWYLKTYFNKVKTESAIGEITPGYSFYEQVPKRIVEVLGPEVKFILILRHPVDRALSQYNMMRSRNLEKREFFEALKQEFECISSLEHKIERNYSYLERGYYSKQIENYLQYFNKKQLLILSFEKEIIKNIEPTIIKIENFLNLSHCSNINYKIHSNKSNVQNRYLIPENIIGILKVFADKLPKKVQNRLQGIVKKESISLGIKLTPEQRKELFIKYYNDEFNLINKLTGNKFSYWI